MRFFLALGFFVSLLFNSFAQTYVPFKTGGWWKLYDPATKKFTDERYQDAIATAGNVILLKQDYRWGALKNDGSAFLPFTFEILKCYKNGLFHAQRNDSIWIYNSKNELISKSYFLEASPFKNDSSLLVVKVANKKYGIITAEGKPVVPFNYQYAPEHFNKNYLKVGIEKKSRPLYGLMDKNFELFIPVKYRTIIELNNSHFLAALPNGKYVLYNKKGKIIWTGKYEVSYVWDNFFNLRDGEQRGVYARSSKKTFWPKASPTVYDKEKFIMWRDNENETAFFIDDDGKKTEVPGYKIYTYNRSSLFLCEKISDNREEKKRSRNNKCGLINHHGKIILQPKYEIIKQWTNDFCVVGRSWMQNVGGYRQDFGVINLKTGDTIVPIENLDIKIFESGFSAVKQNKTWSLYTPEGKKLNDTEYKDINPYRNGWEGTITFKNAPLIQVVKITGTYPNGNFKTLTGFIDDSCHEIIPPVYVSALEIKDRYSNSLSSKKYSVAIPPKPGTSDTIFNSQGICALMDENFKLLTPYKFTALGPYFHSYIVTHSYEMTDGENRALSGLIDTLGNEIIEPVYDEIIMVHKNGIIAKKNGRMCFLDHSGKEIIPFKFQRMSFFNDTLLTVNLWDMHGIYDVKGNEILRPSYLEFYYEVDLNGTLFRIRKNNDYFYADKYGTEFRTKKE